MHTIILQGETIRSRADFHQQLKSQLDFPSYYGNNLDALWDMLTGWIDLPLTIVWKNFKASKIFLEDDMDDIVTILNDAERELDGFRVMYGG